MKKPQYMREYGSENNTKGTAAMVDLALLNERVQKGDAKETARLVEEALREGRPAEEILNLGLVDAMKQVGEDMKTGVVFVPEVLLAARAMSEGMKSLEPALTAEGVKERGTLVIGTVKGDLHDIGKNLVAMMYKGAGFKVIDLGTNVSAEQFIEAARANNADVVGLSALLTTTMGYMKEIITKCKEAGIAALFEVGGAPVTQTFAQDIGADVYGKDAAEAVERVLAKMER